jgi:NADPH2:quinone reductase
MSKFRAYRIHHANQQHQAGIMHLKLDEIEGEGILIRTNYSSVNYKDALAGSGRGNILRRSPLIGGIDSCGEVTESGDPRFSVGDQVLVTGCGLSETHNGGYAEWLRAPADIIVPLPSGLSPFEAMAIGTAGFTAALALYRMEQNGQTPEMGPIAITGASGGVGCLAIDIFSKKGYEVVAITGKAQQQGFLQGLGTSRIIGREALSEVTTPLAKGQWGGVIDTVGGTPLAQLIASTRPWGNVACIGLAAGIKLHTTVMPFILRGVSLLGIDSTGCPYGLRRELWQRLGADLKPSHLKEIAHNTIALEGLDQAFEEMLAGHSHGRTLVDTRR